MPSLLPFFVLLPPLISTQFGTPVDPQTASRIREILVHDGPPSSVFRVQSQTPDFGFRNQESIFLPRMPEVPSMPNMEGPMPISPEIRFAPTAIRITPSAEQRMEEQLDPHEWSRMTVFVKMGSNGRTFNDDLARILYTWIRTTKGQMEGRFTSTTPLPTMVATSTASPTPIPPPPLDGIFSSALQSALQPLPPPTEFVDRDSLTTRKATKTQVFDPRMPTIVEGWPLQGEFFEKNPLIEEDSQFTSPETFQEMLKICPMYPETATIFVHKMVKRDYSIGFGTKVECRCGDGSHESFIARKSKPLLSDQTAALDPNFIKSDLIVGRFSCAFPGNICVRTENGMRLRSMDWQTHVFPAVGSGGGWANSYILLMENGTKLEDADTRKIYLGASQFDGERRKSRLEHSYLRIKSISCDSCAHPLTCQR